MAISVATRRAGSIFSSTHYSYLAANGFVSVIKAFNHIQTQHSWLLSIAENFCGQVAEQVSLNVESALLVTTLMATSTTCTSVLDNLFKSKQE